MELLFSSAYPYTPPPPSVSVLLWVLLAPATFTLSAPPQIYANSSTLLLNGGGSAVDVVIPFPMWTSAEAIASSAPPQATAPSYLWIRGTPSALACSSDAVLPTLLHCYAPPGHGVNQTVVLALGGLLNLTAAWSGIRGVGRLSYEPPSPSSVSPSWLQIPDASVGGVVMTSAVPSLFRLDVTFSGFATDIPFIEAMSITGVPCANISYSSMIVSCLGWSSSAFLNTLSNSSPLADSEVDSVPMNISFFWSGRVEPPEPRTLGTLVVRPTVSSISPLTLSAGSIFIIFGFNFCPPSGCSLPLSSYLSGRVGDRPCSGLRLITAQTATCSAPAVSTFDAGYPQYNFTLINQVNAASSASGAITVTYQTSGAVINASALPAQFIPCDSGSKWPIDRPINVHLLPPLSRTPYNASIFTCSLVSLTPGVLLLPMSVSDLSSVPSDAAGLVSFGVIAIQAFFNASSPKSPVRITLSSTCTSVDVPIVQALAFTLEAYALYATFCALPPSSAPSQAALAPFSIGLEVAGLTDAGGTARTCSTNRSWMGPLLPPSGIVCSISTLAVSNSSGLGGGGSAGSSPIIISSAENVQGRSSSLDMPSGTASFTGTSISGAVEQYHNLSIACSIGNIPIPPTLTSALYITGCSPGTAPSASGSTCLARGSSQYSQGGSAPCRACPSAGVACSGGLLTPSPGFFRPPSEAGSPLDGNSELLPCAFPQGCVVDATTLTFGCAQGYSGPLCGVCDPGADYTQQGDACVPCLPDSSNLALIGLALCALFILLIVFVVRRADADSKRLVSEEEKEGSMKASISLRILLTHIQMLGALRIFKTSGTALFKSYMSWANFLGTAAITDGPMQCTLRPSFVSSFLGILALPIIAAACAMAIMATSALLSAAQRYYCGYSGAWRRPFGLCCSESAAKQQQRMMKGAAVSTFSSASTWKSEKKGGKGQQQQDLQQQQQQEQQQQAPKQERLTILQFAKKVSPEAPRVRPTCRHSVVFVLNLSYMPVISACLKIFNCTPRIAGISYLLQDLRVECAGPAYAGIASLAALVILGLGLGYPLFIFRLLLRARAPDFESKRFESTWGFLYMGYKRGGISNELELAPLPPPTGASPPPSLKARFRATVTEISSTLVWWESTVLLRKAGIVLLGNLVSSATAQITGVGIWISFFLVSHFRFIPYKASAFNYTEALSLFTISITAAMCPMVADPYDTSSSAVAVTVIMLLINFFSLVMLSLQWLGYAVVPSVSALARALMRRNLTGGKNGSSHSDGAGISGGSALVGRAKRRSTVISKYSGAETEGGRATTEEYETAGDGAIDALHENPVRFGASRPTGKHLVGVTAENPAPGSAEGGTTVGGGRIYVSTTPAASSLYPLKLVSNMERPLVAHETITFEPTATAAASTVLNLMLEVVHGSSRDHGNGGAVEAMSTAAGVQSPPSSKRRSRASVIRIVKNSIAS